MKKIFKRNKRKIIYLLFVALIISLLSPYLFVHSVSAAGSIYYVSASGSNTNPGTLAQPWRTIQKAANTVTQGDTVYIRGGWYNEKVTFTNVQGTSTAWIKFAPYNNEDVIVSGSGIGTGYDGIFEFNDGCKYIQITGLEITNTNGHGVFLLGGEINYIRIDHCTIHNCQSSGIYATSASQPTKYVRNIEFDYNTVYDVNNGLSYSSSSYSPQEAISFSNVQGFNIHHNTLSAYGKEGIDAKSGSSNGLIHHNTISTSLASPNFQWDYNHAGIYIDGYVNLNHDISVYSNTITGYGGPGIVIGAEKPQSGGSVEDIYIYNNVIALSHLTGHVNYRAIDSCYDCPFKDISIYSNTIYNGGSSNSAIRIFPSASHIVNLKIANNIITGAAYTLICFQLLRSTEISGRLTLTNNLYYRFGDAGHNQWYDGFDKTWGSNYLLNDPNYINRNTLNFHLQSSSPAINRGIASISPSNDYDGIVRPQGTGVDIGAYEYISTTNNPVVFSGMTPANGTTSVPLTTSTLSLSISDPEGKSFSFTIQTRPNVGSITVNNVYGGTKYCTISGLAYGTTYRWWVNATDGSTWTRRWYTFTTASNPTDSSPAFSAMSPANGTTNVPLTTSTLSLSISDPEGKSFSFTIQTRPNVGSITVNNVYGGTKYCTISGLAYGTTYRWWVNATDGSTWTRRWYTFTTAPNPLNKAPTFSSMTPSNRSTNIPTNTVALSLSISDPEGKSFSFTIQTRPNVGSITVNNVYGGTKYCTISGLAYGTTYRWWVNATDGSTWTRQWYTFTTKYDAGSTVNPPDNGGTNPVPPDTGDTPQNNPPNSPSTPIGERILDCNMNYTYTTASIDLDDDQVRIRFNWGDGSYSNWSDYMDSNTNFSSTHAWSSPSNYSITVIAQDSNGSYSSWSLPLAITVSEPGTRTDFPLIEIKTSTNGSVNQTILFDATNSTDTDSAIISYHWTFGDGATATGVTSHHSYAKPGVYQVNLTVTDDTKQSFTFTKTIEILIEVTTEPKVTAKVSSFSYTNATLLIAECILVVGLLLLSRKRNTPKTQKPEQSHELSLEEKIDMLLLSRDRK